MTIGIPRYSGGFSVERSRAKQTCKRNIFGKTTIRHSEGFIPKNLYCDAMASECELQFTGLFFSAEWKSACFRVWLTKKIEKRYFASLNMTRKTIRYSEGKPEESVSTMFYKFTFKRC